MTKVNLLNQPIFLLNNFSATSSDSPRSEDRTNSATSTSTESEQVTATAPSMFLVNTAFAVKQIKLSEEVLARELKPTKCEQLGRMLGHAVLQSRPELKERLPFLEQPSSLNQYYDSMPQTLAKFFDGVISVLVEKKQQVLARKRKQLNQPPPKIEETAITKITLLFTSVILTVAFSYWKIWLTHILASLCQQPKVAILAQKKDGSG